MLKTDKSQFVNKMHFHGRRKGHSLSARQKALLENSLPKLALTINNSDADEIDLNAVFGRAPSPFWFEIGFGKGEHIAEQAKQNPNVNILGCEPFINGVVGLLDILDKTPLTNVRIYPDDARNVMTRLPDACVDKVFLLHPDPWPKNRHEGRRFISQENLQYLSRIMKDGAELRVGTDQTHYARWVMTQIYKQADFTWCADSIDSWRVRPDNWPETRYQQKATKEGIEPVYLRFKRNHR